jgi:hypothetical protein
MAVVVMAVVITHVAAVMVAVTMHIAAAIVAVITHIAAAIVAVITHIVAATVAVITRSTADIGESISAARISAAGGMRREQQASAVRLSRATA